MNHLTFLLLIVISRFLEASEFNLIVFMNDEFHRIQNTTQDICCKDDLSCIANINKVTFKVESNNWDLYQGFSFQKNIISIPEESLNNYSENNKYLVTRSLFHEFGHVCLNSKKLLPEELLSRPIEQKNKSRHQCLVSVLNDFFTSFKSSSFNVRPDIWIDEIFADTIFADPMSKELGTKAFPDGYVDEEHIPPQYYRHCLK